MSLTAETIAETWNDGETVQIQTAADWNTFVAYLKANPTASEVRNAELTEDIDLSDTTLEYFESSTNGLVRNMILDGNGHSIKNAVLNLTSSAVIIDLYRPTSGGTTQTIKNLNIKNCHVAGNKSLVVLRATTMNNVSLSNCRFEVSNYTGMYTVNAELCSQNVTTVCSSSYTAFNGSSNGTLNKCVVINDVTYTGASTSAIASDLGGNAKCRQCFSRSRFDGYPTVTIYNGYTIEGSYAANPLTSVNTYNPFTGSSITASYYDNTIAPSASSGTTYGLSTAELQSVAAMQGKGWNVKAVG